jgi:hypothetical protein
MTFRQCGLDRRLALVQPVQRGVEFVLVDRAEAKYLAETGRGGARRERAGGGKFRGGIEDAADSQREHQVAT